MSSLVNVMTTGMSWLNEVWSDWISLFWLSSLRNHQGHHERLADASLRRGQKWINSCNSKRCLMDQQLKRREERMMSGCPPVTDQYADQAFNPPSLWQWHGRRISRGVQWHTGPSWRVTEMEWVVGSRRINDWHGSGRRWRYYLHLTVRNHSVMHYTCAPCMYGQRRQRRMGRRTKKKMFPLHSSRVYRTVAFSCKRVFGHNTDITHSCRQNVQEAFF